MSIRAEKEDMKIISDIGIENLRFGIVKQAIVDYDKSLKYLRKHTPPKTEFEEKEVIRCGRLKRYCEDFFRSKWFSMLCDLDGEILMQSIRQKYYNRPIRWRNE